MCQAVASQMRDGTFFLPPSFFFSRCIFLCFLFRPNEVGPPVATWAGRPDTRDALTSPFTKSDGDSSSSSPFPPLLTLSPPEDKYLCRHTVCEGARAYGQVGLLTHTLARCLQHIYYQSCRPVYFYCLETASIHYPQIFFSFCLSCLSFFFFLNAFRSPTNELNTEETWKRLDEAWLFEQRGDNIVPYDYRHLYQQKQERTRGSEQEYASFHVFSCVT